jgi:2-oxoglutarate dehydrogenase E2 component (dihydrolipoamide succinyltransferase)
MSIELKVPPVGESITEVQIGEWLKSEGERAERDDPVVVIESDKVTLEIPAPVSGVVQQVLKKAGEMARIGEVIGTMEEGGDGTAPPRQAKKAGKAAPVEKPQPAEKTPAPAKAPKAEKEAKPAAAAPPPAEKTAAPAKTPKAEEEAAPAPTKAPAPPPAPEAPPAAAKAVTAGAREEEAVPMTPLRRRIAERLVEAQRNAALLTTFNEADMSAVMEVRKEHQEAFQAKHGVKLGLMSFFVRASIDALRFIPQVNAEIRGDQIVYRNYQDIGIAVATDRGLVVPILRNAERMSFAEIEKAIGDFAARAREGKLKLEELQGGTFTITNGGVFGSLLSTPIVNPPQSGVLGLHAIQDRPVARGGQVVIRPMMYIALSYDHRIVDGREAVTFLKRVKECIESPLRLLIET